jgi:hypothetical protein
MAKGVNTKLANANGRGTVKGNRTITAGNNARQSPPAREEIFRPMRVYPVHRVDITSLRPIDDPVNVDTNESVFPATEGGMVSLDDPKKWRFAIALNVSKPSLYTNMTGIGAEAQAEFPLNRKFYLTASAGYNFFYGTFPLSKDSMGIDTLKGKDFANAPLLAGIRYYVSEALYLSAEAGVAIGAHSNNSTHLALAPSVGWRIPVRRSNIDVGIRFMRIAGGATIPENPPLKKGEYNIWSLRIAYVF